MNHMILLNFTLSQGHNKWEHELIDYYGQVHSNNPILIQGGRNYQTLTYFQIVIHDDNSHNFLDLDCGIWKV